MKRLGWTSTYWLICDHCRRQGMSGSESLPGYWTEKCRPRPFTAADDRAEAARQDHGQALMTFAEEEPIIEETDTETAYGTAFRMSRSIKVF